MRGMDQRELGRKERAYAEMQRQIRRYDRECGPVVIYTLTSQQLEQVLSGEKTVDDFKEDA